MTQTKRSYAAAFRAMTAAFSAAEDQILGKGRAWEAQNPQQERLLREVFPFTYPEVGKIPEAKTCVAWAAAPINDFLAGEGMDIRLEDFEPDTFGFAAVMTVLCPWLVQGTPKGIEIDGTRYTGARLEAKRVKGGMSVTFSASKHFKEPIATVRTRSNDVVHITKFDEDLDVFDLAARARELTIDAERVHDFGGVHFPTLDLDVCPDVGWLLGLATTSEAHGRGELVQALAQVKLKMNHKGAVVKDAFAAAMTFECCSFDKPKPDLVVDGSLLFVLDRPGLTQPVISIVARADSFKDPGDLGLEDTLTDDSEDESRPSRASPSAWA